MPLLLNPMKSFHLLGNYGRIFISQLVNQHMGGGGMGTGSMGPCQPHGLIQHYLNKMKPEINMKHPKRRYLAFNSNFNIDNNNENNFNGAIS